MTKGIAYLQLMRLHRPVGIWLLLWPTLWALWVAAQGIPQSTLLIKFILGVVIMRSAGCIINDVADEKYDRHIKRTSTRPIVSGKVSKLEALILFSILISLAGIIVLTMNKLTIVIAFAALLLAILYPFCKRFTHLPQLVLGMAFSCSIPMAFSAQNQILEWTPILILYAATMAWTVAYDTAYAMADREEDISVGIKSTAILFGKYDIAIIMALHATFLSLLFLLGIHHTFSWPYYASLSIAGIFIARQYMLIRNRQPEDCFKAFLNNQYVGAIIFGGILAQYWIT